MEWFFYEIWGIITGIWGIVINDSVLISIATISFVIIVIIWVRAVWQRRPHSFILALAVTLFILLFAIFSSLFYYKLVDFIGLLYKIIADILIDNLENKTPISSFTFRNISLSVAGSIMLLITALGVVLSIIRSILTRQQNNTDERRVSIDEQRVVTEQISRAVDQIGAYKRNANDEDKPNIEVRLGGIYSLERIARDSDRDYTKIMDILCAYVRASVPFLELENPKKKEDKKIKISEDIQAAIDVLGTKKKWLSFWKWGKSRVNLENCDLSGYRFSELDFSRGNDSNNGTIFDDSLFKKSEFHRTNLSYVSFDEANLTEANFEYAKLIGARFLGTTFKDTKVHGADFSKAKKLTQEQVNEMIGDTDTKLPNGLKLSRIEESPKLKKS